MADEIGKSGDKALRIAQRPIRRKPLSKEAMDNIQQDVSSAQATTFAVSRNPPTILKPVRPPKPPEPPMRQYFGLTPNASMTTAEDRIQIHTEASLTVSGPPVNSTNRVSNLDATLYYDSKEDDPSMPEIASNLNGHLTQPSSGLQGSQNQSMLAQNIFDSGSTRTAKVQIHPGLGDPAAPSFNHALQSYQTQLELLAQQNKERLIAARKEQDEISSGKGGAPLTAVPEAPLAPSLSTLVSENENAWVMAEKLPVTGIVERPVVRFANLTLPNIDDSGPKVPLSLLPQPGTWSALHAPVTEQDHATLVSRLLGASRKLVKLPAEVPHLNHERWESQLEDWSTKPEAEATLENQITAGQGLSSTGGMNTLIAEALEPPRLSTAKCSLLLCMFRNKAYDCISTRIEVFDPETKSEWNDGVLWTAIVQAYRKDIRNWRRRLFGLKTTKAIRLLHYNARSRPIRLEDETYFTKQDLMYAFMHPSKIKTERDWIDWVFLLKSDPDNRYALEFVEDWDGMRIVHIGVSMLTAIVFAAVLWSGLGGDLQTVFTVAAFALAVGTTFVALLAVYSQVDH